MHFFWPTENLESHRKEEEPDFRGKGLTVKVGDAQLHFDIYKTHPDNFWKILKMFQTLRWWSPQEPKNQNLFPNQG